MCTWHCSRSKWKPTIVRRRLGQPTDRPTACQGLLSVIPSRGARPSCDRRHTCRRLSCAPRTTGSFCVPIRTRKLRTISIKTQSNQAQANAAKVAQNSRGCGRGSGLQIDYVLGAQMRLRADAVNFRDYCCATTTQRELCAVHASGRLSAGIVVDAQTRVGGSMIYWAGAGGTWPRLRRVNIAQLPPFGINTHISIRSSTLATGPVQNGPGHLVQASVCASRTVRVFFVPLVRAKMRAKMFTDTNHSLSINTYTHECECANQVVSRGWPTVTTSQPPSPKN